MQWLNKRKYENGNTCSVKSNDHNEKKNGEVLKKYK